MLDDFGRPLQRAHLADAGDVAAVPLHAELEVLVRIESLRVDAELMPFTAVSVLQGLAGDGSGLHLAGHLLDLDDHELGGLERREPDEMLTMPRLMSFWVVVSLSHLTK